MTSSNFYSKFRFHPRILRYRQFRKFAWADSKNFHCTQWVRVRFGPLTRDNRKFENLSFLSKNSSLS